MVGLMKLIAIMYGTKLAAFDKASGRVILASVVDTKAAFANWVIKSVEQDKIAPASVIAGLEDRAAKDGSKIIEL